MARSIDVEKLKAAWNAIKNGASNRTCGIHPTQAPVIRAFIEGGWEWSQFIAGFSASGLSVFDYAGQQGVGPNAGKAIRIAPLRPTAPPPPKMTVIERDKTEAEAAQAEMHWRGRREARIQKARLLRERELNTADKMIAFADKSLESASPFIRTKRTMTPRREACGKCGAPVTVEEVHIHPLRIDVTGMVSMYKEGFNRSRIALNMPTSVTSLRVKDGHGEMSEAIEQVDDAFRAAFTAAVEGGRITESLASSIWDDARLRMTEARKRES